jgi:hypothetical protein
MFTLHFFDDPLDDVLVGSSHGALCHIDPEYQEGIRNELRSLGIDGASLFPDLAHLGDHIASL